MLKAIVCPESNNIYSSTDDKVKKLAEKAEIVIFEFIDLNYKNHVLAAVDNLETASKVKSLFFGRLRDLGPDSTPAQWGKIGFEITHTDISAISQKLKNAGIEVITKSSSHLKLIQ